MQTHSVEDAFSPFAAWQVGEYLNVIQVASWKQRCCPAETSFEEHNYMSSAASHSL